MREFLLLVLLLLLHDKAWCAKVFDHPPPLSSKTETYQPRSLPAPSSSAAFSSNMPGMARLEAMDVKCGRTGMNVELKFTSTFPGVVYSKGHFSDPACMYVKESDRRSSTYRFTVPLDGCGTTGQLHEIGGGAAVGRDESTVENTIILQSDPLIQEVWDEARSITCTWRHRMEKSVNFLPFKVYEPDTIDVQLDARSVNTLMEIQKGVGGPLSSSPTGYVHMGDDISVVMYVQGAKMDANVVSCNATTASGSKAVQLVDSRGCLLRPDLLTPFAKTTNTNGVDADLMLYSYLKAFNIAENPEFIIACEMELCEDSCPDPCIGGPHKAGRRKKRSQDGEEEEEVLEVLEDLVDSSSSPSSSYRQRVKLERGVVVLSKRHEERERCLFQSATALLSLGLLMTLVSSLGVLSAVLGHKLWALKAEMRRKNLY